MFFNAQGRLRSMLVTWTSLAEQDLFAQASAGRSWFRIDDLLRLIALLQESKEPDSPRRRRCQANSAACVKRYSPLKRKVP